MGDLALRKWSIARTLHENWGVPFDLLAQLMDVSAGAVERKAIYLRWFSEYDETTRIRDAVHAALEYVRANDIQHWIVDVTTSPHGLSDIDYAWVNSDAFRSAINNSPLRKFILLPPLPESGQDDSWVADWEANTLAKFGDGISAKVCKTVEEARVFLEA